MIALFQQLEKFVKKTFKTTIAIFFEALRLSPNAQGYVSGSITELLLKQHLETLGYTVKRIREKWEGKKHPNHCGDFYFMNPQIGNWFVLESKGVKSNSEKWHKLYNRDQLIKFLFDHSELIDWIDHNSNTEQQICNWVNKKLPKFQNEYADSLYDYEEIQKYKKNLPKRETDKSRAIKLLEHYDRETIGKMIEERLEYVFSEVKVLETHFVSGTSGRNERTQATPKKDEFNVIAVDIFLRFPEHRFLFANPHHLDSSSEDAEHLKQNYIMGFVFRDENGNPLLHLSSEWTDNFGDVVDSLHNESAINEFDMQIDSRNLVSHEE